MADFNTDNAKIAAALAGKTGHGIYDENVDSLDVVCLARSRGFSVRNASLKDSEDGFLLLQPDPVRIKGELVDGKIIAVNRAPSPVRLCLPAPDSSAGRPPGASAGRRQNNPPRFPLRSFRSGSPGGGMPSWTWRGKRERQRWQR